MCRLPWVVVLVLLTRGLTALGSPGVSAPGSSDPVPPRLTFPVAAFAQPGEEPLPKGVKARIGTNRMREPGGWGGGSLSPDGKFLLAPSPVGLVKHDLATGLPAGQVRREGGGFGGRNEFSADGKRAASIVYDAVVVWSFDTGKQLAKVTHATPYGENAIALSADGKLLALGGVTSEKAKDKPVTAVVWDVDANKKRAEVAVVQNQSAAVALSPDGSVLATWGNHYDPNPPKVEPGQEPPTDPGRVVQFWDVAGGKELSRTVLGGFGTIVVAFGPGGKAAVSNTSGIVRLIDPKTGASPRRFFGRSDQGSRLAFSPDGKLLASAGFDATVQVWEADTGRLVSTVECPVPVVTGNVREVRFTAPDRAVVWSTAGITAVAWEVPSGKVLTPAGGHVGPVTAIVFAAGGKEVVTGGQDGLIFRWDAATGKPLGEVQLRSRGTRPEYGGVALTADAKLAVAERSGTRAVFDLAHGLELFAVNHPAATDARPVLCGDARTLVLAPFVRDDKGPRPKSVKIAVWDTSAGTKLADLDAPPGDLFAAAITPDRTKLVTLVSVRDADGAKSELFVTGWELAGGKKLGQHSEPSGFGQYHLVAAPDNTSAILSTGSNKLTVIDFVAGKAVRSIDTKPGNAACPPAFSPDGRSFAVGISRGFGGSGPQPAVVYDWATGKPLKTVEGHTAGVTAAAFSPDGKTLATGSSDSTVLLWDLGG